MSTVKSFEDFKRSLTGSEAPAGLSIPLQALWTEAQGNWDLAHEMVQSLNSDEAAWVHAYLHRKEGDPANAGYWYRRAGKEAATGSLDAEWASVARALIEV